MSRWLIVERKRKRSHAADSEVEGRIEYKVEAGDKRNIQSRNKRSLSMFKS